MKPLLKEFLIFMLVVVVINVGRGLYSNRESSLEDRISGEWLSLSKDAVIPSEAKPKAEMSHEFDGLPDAAPNAVLVNGEFYINGKLFAKYEVVKGKFVRLFVPMIQQTTLLTPAFYEHDRYLILSGADCTIKLKRSDSH